MKSFLRCLTLLLLWGSLLVSAQAGVFSSVHDKLIMNGSQPRYEKLPLFDPHRKSFSCVHQEQQLPPIDAQAEAWFQQAIALDDPNIWMPKRDYAGMYKLYLQAAQRNHWKAMLNLAALILDADNTAPEHNPEVAIQWVEKAMQLGVPDAYDQMGIYHQNGIVRGGNSTTAYAFFQKAADMGSPAALTFLGGKLEGKYDDPAGEFWGNEAIGNQMLECALTQGYGQAAYELGMNTAVYNTPENKIKALHLFHEGVKLGCEKCANKLSVEFNGAYLKSGDNLVPSIDKARAERYGKIGDMLRFYEGRLKLPNLDKVLPLPPAPLPKWDGDPKTLINAAKAVTPPPKATKPPLSEEDHTPLPLQALALGSVLPAEVLTPMLQAGRLREVPEQEHLLNVSGAATCPQTGIWAGCVALDHPLAAIYNRWDRQAFVQQGTAFPSLIAQKLMLEAKDMHWTYLGSPNAENGGIVKITL